MLLFLVNYMLRQVSPLPEGEDQPPWIRKKKLDGWRLLGSIGKGSFGEVFLAEDDSGARKALKVFHPSRSGRDAFDIEYDGMEMVRHLGGTPGLVPVESIGRTKYCIYYTMPLADALPGTSYTPHTLYNRTEKNDLDEKELLDIAASVLAALDFLHGKGLLHRDVKPDNIMRVNGAWCLGDPGLISTRRPRRFAGTQGFYPEKKRFRADASTDLYALGKTLYCAATRMSADQYPLVPEPEHYDYDRYSKLRPIWRNAVEGKYKTAAEMKNAVMEAAKNS